MAEQVPYYYLRDNTIRAATRTSKGTFGQHYDTSLSQIIRNIVNEQLQAKSSSTKEDIGDSKPIKTKSEDFSMEKASSKNKWGWKLSTASATMMVTNAVTMGSTYLSAYASTDKAKQEQMLVKNATNYGLLTMGAVGGPYGMIAAILGSFIKNSFGDILFNNLQRQHDNRRLAYKMSNYDLAKYSTYVYDYDSASWRAESLEKAKSNILGRN